MLVACFAIMLPGRWHIPLVGARLEVWAVVEIAELLFSFFCPGWMFWDLPSGLLHRSSWLWSLCCEIFLGVGSVLWGM